jgi:hypothetical protein
MAHVFTGDVILPGDGGPGLSAAMTVDAGTITLRTGDEVLGTWGGHNVLVQPDRGGRFLVTLGGEDLYFKPDSPSEFATAVTAPLQGEANKPKKRRKEKAKEKAVDDNDAIIEKLVATVKPLRSIDDDDDIITPGLLGGIIVVAVLIFAAVVGVTVMV